MDRGLTFNDCPAEIQCMIWLAAGRSTGLQKIATEPTFLASTAAMQRQLPTHLQFPGRDGNAKNAEINRYRLSLLLACKQSYHIFKDRFQFWDLGKMNIISSHLSPPGLLIDTEMDVIRTSQWPWWPTTALSRIGCVESLSMNVTNLRISRLGVLKARSPISLRMHLKVLSSVNEIILTIHNFKPIVVDGLPFKAYEKFFVDVDIDDRLFTSWQRRSAVDNSLESQARAKGLDDCVNRHEYDTHLHDIDQVCGQLKQFIAGRSITVHLAMKLNDTLFLLKPNILQLWTEEHQLLKDYMLKKGISENNFKGISGNNFKGISDNNFKIHGRPLCQLHQ